MNRSNARHVFAILCVAVVAMACLVTVFVEHREVVSQSRVEAAHDASTQADHAASNPASESSKRKPPGHVIPASSSRIARMHPPDRTESSRLPTAHSGRYDNTITRTCDVAGRPHTETQDLDGNLYTSTRFYDVNSRIKELIYPDNSKCRRTYTPRWQLHQTWYTRNSGYGEELLETRTYDDGMRLEPKRWDEESGSRPVQVQRNTITTTVRR